MECELPSISERHGKQLVKCVFLFLLADSFFFSQIFHQYAANENMCQVDFCSYFSIFRSAGISANIKHCREFPEDARTHTLLVQLKGSPRAFRPISNLVLAYI
jgi:hypothetical protein